MGVYLRLYNPTRIIYHSEIDHEIITLTRLPFKNECHNYLI